MKEYLPSKVTITKEDLDNYINFLFITMDMAEDVFMNLEKLPFIKGGVKEMFNRAIKSTKRFARIVASLDPDTVELLDKDKEFLKVAITDTLVQYKAEREQKKEQLVLNPSKVSKVAKKQAKKRVVYFDADVVAESKKNILQNNLIKYLCGVFGQDYVLNALNKYDIGTNDKGETLFWYKNFDGQFVCAKAIKYKVDGEQYENSEPYYIYANKDSKPQKCFFGEHLLNASNPTVYVEKSEKSAFVGELSGTYRDEVFLASGSANGSSVENMNIFEKLDLQVTVFCD